MSETGPPTDTPGTGASSSTPGLFDSAAEAKSDRIVAYLIDFVLLAVLAFGILVAGTLVGSILGLGVMDVGEPAEPGEPAETEGVLAATLIEIVVMLFVWTIIAAILLAYFTVLDAGDGTLGKRIADVDVVRTDGSPATKRETAIRTAVLLAPLPVMALVQAILPLGSLLAVGIMCVWLLIEAGVLFASDGGQRLGDRAADTLVVPAR